MNPNQTQVGPHEFKRLGLILHRRKCEACYLPPERHPVLGYTAARPLFDRRKRPS